ncbi:hypothetical protein N9C85_00985 [Synechococcus sp. AH-224-I15]|nr:hypothetical protein [Synechococcus sp. AH-224-I15]
MQTQLTPKGVLVKEGCPWASFEGMELFLAINNTFADMGFAFGHGEFDRDKVEAMFMGPDDSPLADEIQKCGLIRSEFEVRVTRGLQNLVAKAIEFNPATSWSGYGFDIAHMGTGEQGSVSWEYATGECLFGCHISTTRDRDVQWLCTGLMDPGMWLQDKEGWVTYGLASEILGDPEEIKALTYDSVGEKAFGKEEG